MSYFGRRTFIPEEAKCVVCDKHTKQMHVRDWDSLPRTTFHVCEECKPKFLVWEAKEQFTAGIYPAWEWIRRLPFTLDFLRSSGAKQKGHVLANDGLFHVCVVKNQLALPLCFEENKGHYMKAVPLTLLYKLNELPPFHLDIPPHFNDIQSNKIQTLIENLNH